MRRLVCNLTFVSLTALAFTGCGANSSNNDIHDNVKRTDEDGGASRDEGVSEVNDGGAEVDDGGSQGDKPSNSDDGGGRDDGTETDEDTADDETGNTGSSGPDGSTDPIPTDTVGSTDTDATSDPGDTETDTDDTDTGAGGTGNEPTDVDETDDTETDDTEDTVDTDTDDTGTVTVPEELEDCEPQGDGYSGYCYVSYYCESKPTSAYAECYDYGDGTQCSCSASHADGTSTNLSFEVDEVTGRETCETLAIICADNQQPQFTGEFECSLNSESLDTYGCSRSQQCVREATIGEFVVREVKDKSLSCYDYDTEGLLSCNCYDGLDPANNKTLILDDTTLADACGVMTDLCWNGVTPTPVGAPTCAPYESAKQSNESNCNDAIMCSQTATVDGEETTLSETTYANCLEGNDGEWTCSCQLNNASIEFNVTPGADSAATCTSAVGNCDEALAAETPGDLTCEYYSKNNSGQEYCSARLKCYKEGTLGETEVRRTGFVSTDCYNQGDSWQCSCYSENSGEYKNITPPDASVPAEDVCVQAVADCAGQVDPSVGVNGNGGGFPTPGGPIFIDDVAAVTTSVAAGR